MLMTASLAATPSFEPCRLCGDFDRLIRGHVIPQFVYRAYVFTTATGLDRRAHDGPTRPMLCRRCEGEFSRHESEFARELFHPLRKNREVRVTYRAWLREFAASVCWRILDTASPETVRASALERWSAELATTRDVWRDFLNGRRRDLGSHHLHLIAWSPNSGAPTDPQPIGMDVVDSEHDAFVVARLGLIILVGVIHESDPEAWQGTRLQAGGRVKPRDWAIPQRVRAYLMASGSG